MRSFARSTGRPSIARTEKSHRCSSAVPCAESPVPRIGAPSPGHNGQLGTFETCSCAGASCGGGSGGAPAHGEELAASRTRQPIMRIPILFGGISKASAAWKSAPGGAAKPYAARVSRGIRTTGALPLSKEPRPTGSPPKSADLVLRRFLPSDPLWASFGGTLERGPAGRLQSSPSGPQCCEGRSASRISTWRRYRMTTFQRRSRSQGRSASRISSGCGVASRWSVPASRMSSSVQ